jgi:RNA polymerase sigma factor (sigma-70 family)
MGEIMNAWHVRTPWTALIDLQSGKQEQLTQLLETYSGPLYSYFRALSLSRSDAEDLSQQVMMDFFLVRESHRAIDRARGRFRDYLLTSARNALLDFKKKAKAARRGGGVLPVSLDHLSESGNFEPVSKGSPEDEFEVQWALASWRAAMEMLRDDWPQLAEVIEIFYVGEPTTQVEAAKRIGISVGCFNSRSHLARKQLMDCLGAVLSPTLEDASELPGELKKIRDILGRNREILRQI